MTADGSKTGLRRPVRPFVSRSMLTVLISFDPVAVHCAGGGGGGPGEWRGGRGWRGFQRGCLFLSSTPPNVLTSRWPGRGGRRGGGGGGRSVFNPADYWDARVLENPWRRLEFQLGLIPSEAQAQAQAQEPGREAGTDREQDEGEEATSGEPATPGDPNQIILDDEDEDDGAPAGEYQTS